MQRERLKPPHSHHFVSGMGASRNAVIIEASHSARSCAGYLGHPFRKKLLESDLVVQFCLQERSDKGRIREHACISRFGIFLFAKEKPVFPVLIPMKQRLALCFHALHNGIIRWMKPHSTSLLLGTIADLARGKSQLLVENALLR